MGSGISTFRQVNDLNSP